MAHERVLPIFVMACLDKDWTALTAGVNADTTWAGTSESFKSVTGVVRVKVKPASGSGYSGQIGIYEDEILTKGSEYTFDDGGTITDRIVVTPGQTIKVLMSNWAGTGTVDIHILNS